MAKQSEPSKSGYVYFKGEGKTMWLVVDTDGDTMRFYSKRQCQAWISRAEANAEDNAKWAEEERKARIETINAYLAVRAWRAAEAAKQGSFSF